MKSIICLVVLIAFLSLKSASGEETVDTNKEVSSVEAKAEPSTVVAPAPEESASNDDDLSDLDNRGVDDLGEGDDDDDDDDFDDDFGESGDDLSGDSGDLPDDDDVPVPEAEATVTDK